MSQQGHLTDRQIADYDGRRLSPVDLIAVSDHVASCASCQERMRIDARAVRSFVEDDFPADPLPPSPHLSPDELAAYVDRTLSAIGLELAEGHLEECSACQEDVRDLEAFRAAPIAPARRRGAAWVAGLGAAAALLLVAMRVLAPSASPPRLVLNDSAGRITLDAHGEWSGLAAFQAPEGDRILRALMEGKLEVPAELLALRGRRSELRSPEDTLGPSLLESPLGVVVESDRPLFRWQPVPGAKRYVVTVFNAALAQTVTSPPLSQMEWKAPHAFPRGETYLWQVAAQTGSGTITMPAPPEPEARFVVLSAENVELLRAARGQAGGSHLALAVAYARVGLLEEAERELEGLVRLNPEAPLPEALLADLRRRSSPRAQNPTPTTAKPAQ